MENAATRFGQRLAHTEKKYRDQALKKLTVYLTKKSEWSALEWDKLWKALFYCMWMSDKRPIQEELSTSLSQLVHKLPTTELALGFVHSFFRTMHREWHGIDGLRLDKFYSLVRKFVHESVALLRNNDWEREDVGFFVSILSSEVVSQLPNGLRMHLSDLFLEETWKAAGASIETDAFVLLLEPFFTLLSSEYDKAVFKRVRELVFLPMLSEYKFGPQVAKKPAKKKKKSGAADESGETDDDGEDDEEDKVFEQVELAYVQHRLFAIASADDTAERNRSALYSLYSKFFALTKVDSLKAAQEGTSTPKSSPKPTKKVSKGDEAAAKETPAAGDAANASEKKSKNKKRKKHQVDAEDAAAAVDTTPVVEPVAEAEPEKATKKQKKQKTQKTQEEVATKVETPAVVVASDKKSKKKAQKIEIVEKAQEEEAPPVESSDKKSKKKKQKAQEEEATKAEVAAAVETSAKKAKKSKKTAAEAATPVKEEAKKPAQEEAKKIKEEAKKQPKIKEEPAKKQPKIKEPAKTNESKDVAAPMKKEKKKAVKSEEPAQPEKPKKQIVVKSGVKFQRCAVCKGFGKGFLPAGKDVCGHCERGQKAQKKAAAAVAKKRKASEIAASSAAAEAEAANAKKVTFGKNKALPHELSVKRLKASAKKEPVPKEEASIKGVLKATSAPPSSTKLAAKKDKKAAGKGRMKAADFF